MSRTLRNPPPSAVGADVGGHQLALGGISADFVASCIIERLGELLFLRADHVADVPADSHLVILLAATGDRLEEVALDQRIMIGGNDFRQGRSCRQ